MVALHAVAAGLAGDDQAIGAGQAIEQAAVELRAFVVGPGHLGLHGAVVLGPGVESP